MSNPITWLFSPGELLFLMMLPGILVGGIVLTIQAAAKACTTDTGKKLAVGTAKVAGKTAGRIAWEMFRKRMGF